MTSPYDAVVVGAGPNGLSAAIVLASAGLSTLLIEARDSAGGGARSAELTLPGFVHDVCSTVHPLGLASPFFQSLRLERFGLAWCDPPLALAHVLNDGSAVTLERSLDATARGLGDDQQAYLDLLGPFVEQAPALLKAILGPLRPFSSPLLQARFGLVGLRSLTGLAASRFQTPAARALLAGMGAHAMQPLTAPGTASFGLVLAVAAHLAGWPVARGGTGAITDALLQVLREHGGQLRLNQPVAHFRELPPARVYLFDVTPRQLLAIAGDELPSGYRKRLARFRYGPGVFKMDWALRGPIAWRDPRCRQSATVHLSGSLDDVALAERSVHEGKLAQQPFVIVVQPSLFDASRAPEGSHTAWAYCHVPWGSELDASRVLEQQIERFAPGFSGLVLARHAKNTLQMEQYNPNYVGGDINGGSATLDQLFSRPVARLDPYSTPARHIFLCSASTPPGGGVHGMCGYWAAKSALRKVFDRSE
jgi:phytoene dehydrogenase-like protein